MPAHAPFPHDPAGISAPRASLPPYAVPGLLMEAGQLAVAGRGRVGPFVPAPWRREQTEPVATPASVPVAESAVMTATVQGGATIEVAAEVSATPAAAMAPVAVHADGAAGGMIVPPSIPPYRPLRPTPIVTPAIRTPLYIPPIPAPASETAVEEEGVIDPMLVDTAEFPIPSAFMADETEAAAPSEPSVVEPAVEPAVAEQAADAEAELPWIDAFLVTTPSLPMAAMPTPVEPVAPVAHGTEAEEASLSELVAAAFATGDAMDVEAAGAVVEAVEVLETEVLETEVVDVEVDGAAADSGPDAVDEWPLDEAAAEFRSLGAQLDAIADAADPGTGRHDAGSLAADATGEPLAPWSDDDLMDIMPIRHSGKTPLSNAALPPDGELWAERARRAHEEAQVFRVMATTQAEARDAQPAASSPEAPEATAEEAAHALEVLAQRVRAGELMLPSYDPRMGEPAALVAALAALLGVRLR